MVHRIPGAMNRSGNAPRARCAPGAASTAARSLGLRRPGAPGACRARMDYDESAAKTDSAELAFRPGPGSTRRAVMTPSSMIAA